MSDVSLLLKRGWENIWKEKLLWLFGGLLLLEPLVQFIPIQNSTGLTLSFLRLVKSFISLLLTTSSYTGVTYIAYCIANGKSADIKATLHIIRKFFWFVVLSFITIFFFVTPFFCLALILSFDQSIQPVELTHNSYIFTLPLSIISALQFFLITEIITSETLIWASLKVSWGVFKSRVFIMSTIGIILGAVSYACDVVIGVTITLIQHGFDVTLLSKFDFISPQLSFTNNNLYEVATLIVQMIWVIYSASIFVLAYTKYKGAAKNKRVKF